MLTTKIDAALDALLACMMRLPALRDCYRPGTQERAALDELFACLQRTDAVLFSQGSVGEMSPLGMPESGAGAGCGLAPGV